MELSCELLGYLPIPVFLEHIDSVHADICSSWDHFSEQKHPQFSSAFTSMD